MDIRKEQLETLWYEDEDGRQIPYDLGSEKIPDKAVYQVSCFPLELRENRIRLKKEKHTQGVDGQSSSQSDINTIYLGSRAEKTIIGMVNSGSYTLSEAILLCAKSCERCNNVLAFKYTNGKEGYEEYGPEWKKCHTTCTFCSNKK